MHWNALGRRPQLTAGLISTEGASLAEGLSLVERQPQSWKKENGMGYHRWFDDVFVPLRKLRPKSQWVLILTCGEMGNCDHQCLHRLPDSHCRCVHENTLPVLSLAADLVEGIATLADKTFERKNRKIQTMGSPFFRNALQGNLRNWEKVRNLLDRANRFRSIRGVSILRMENAIESEPLRELMKRQKEKEEKGRAPGPKAIPAANTSLPPAT